ncbi:lipase 3-like [Onthophagus taurus]|uniref:lipase 3-like n=1 Tax=Onthophagus taurus TaxID=166361 RepID=UPI000C20F43C|nr:lipase 3-like [Onthophagus taurus]
MYRFAFVLLCVAASSAVPTTKDLHPDTGLNVIELVEKYEYPIEIHSVTTKDGYILDLHRIPHGLNNAEETDKPAILLMHCLLCSSGIWVAMGPENGLAFILADLGYDVWMPNARGTTYSKKHTTLDPDEDKKDFWDFSWHEIGSIDVATSIDYILETTGQDSLYHIGHSQGTTSFYVLAADRPEYNDKIRLHISLAPVVYMSHLDNILLQWLAPYADSIETIAHIIGMYEFLPNMETILEILGDVCHNSLSEQCNNIFFQIFGTSENIDEWMMPVIATHLPAGASLKQFVHYAQEIETGKFSKFDYGLVQNLVEYGHVSPPSYDISKITCPIALFYATSDSMAAIEDVDQLSGELPNLVYKYLMPDESFNHIDFLFAEGLVDNMYKRIISLLSKY